MVSSDIYVAKQSFATEIDGQSVIVHKGTTRVRAGHPLLKGRESLFEPLTVQYDVEQATAKPGEQRGAPASAPTPAEIKAEIKAEAKSEKAAEKAAEESK